MTSLARFNAQSAPQAIAHLLTLCGSHRWAETLTARRPFQTPADLLLAAEQVWFALPESDWLEAFAQHPRIGQRKLPTTEFLHHSTTEQSTAQDSLKPVAEALLLANRAYEAKFGFLYIVFASGRTAPELLAVLESRLTHTHAEELDEAARQQHRITTLRMTKWLEA